MSTGPTYGSSSSGLLHHFPILFQQSVSNLLWLTALHHSICSSHILLPQLPSLTSTSPFPLPACWFSIISVAAISFPPPFQGFQLSLVWLIPTSWLIWHTVWLINALLYTPLNSHDITVHFFHYPHLIKLFLFIHHTCQSSSLCPLA